MFAQSEKFWRGVFRFKAVWNCVISVAFMIWDDTVREWLHAPHSDPINRTLFLSLAFAFGLGYWWVGTDLQKNRAVVRMGIFGQLAVFLISTYAVTFAPQPLPWPLALPGVVDLVFAIAYVIFLRRYPEK